MLKTVIAATATALALLPFSSCTGNHDAVTTPTLNLEADASTPTSSPLKVDNLTYAQLSSSNPEAFFTRTNILDVVGDTAILFEDNPQLSRLILFNTADGSYIGQINHRGQGPGEYNRILNAFVDRSARTVLIPDFERPTVNVYSLADDTLVTILDRPPFLMMIEPTGSVAGGINAAQAGPEGLLISQFDGKFAPTDSIFIEGFMGGNASTVWTNADGNGLFMLADTLYTVRPGHLEAKAIMPRGDKALTPEQERELMMRMMSGESEIELLSPYMLIRDIQATGDRMLVTTMIDNEKHSDLYDLTTGRLLYRNTYSDLSLPNSIVITGSDGQEITVERIFARDGRWYGIVAEEQAAERAGTSPADTNCALVSFTL